MKRSNLMLAALTSAVLPNLGLAGVRDSAQANATDEAKGIDLAVVQDASGKLYDVYATDTPDGRKRLSNRVRAAQTLAAAREPGVLGFDVDRVIAFVAGNAPQPGAFTTAQAKQAAEQSADERPSKPSPTGAVSVLVTAHRDGQARSLDLLTLDDCAAVGTALGAIHRLPPNFLAAAKYPMFSTGQIHAQLTAWIKRLRDAGHVPPEITNSWARVIETEGLWSFNTCMVHGGFQDGDILFSGSTITAITNWQDMQVNDPARDLAWIFGKLDETHRNAVLSAYGRMMGSRLDDLIMLRANLWLQMEQVGEFIQALNRGDNDRIVQFKAQVERLAHQLGVINRDSETPAPAAAAAAHGSGKTPGNASAAGPSTITVGTLLKDDERRRAAASTVANAQTPGARTAADTDRTGSAHIVAVGEVDTDTAAADATADRQHVAQPVSAAAVSDQTADRHVAASTGVNTGSTSPQPVSSHSSVTITLKELIEMNEREAGITNSASHADAQASGAAATHTTHTDQTTQADSDDDTGESETPSTASSWAETTVIPLLEREERALRDAHAGLEGYDADGNPLPHQ